MTIDATHPAIPRSREDDYSDEMAAARRAFATERTATSLRHVGSYSLDPASLPGNIENFIGVAQVPIGLAGPLTVHGEHAVGDFFVPMATTEGTLLASYNRGMRLIRECGGATTTVVDDRMQRAPVFTFADAHQARDFGDWIRANEAQLAAVADATTRVGRLRDIEQYAVGPLRFLRFDFTCGDAAGQNMTGKATLAACAWIEQNYPEPIHYLLSGNIDTDKKHSQLNTLHTRGKRVVAEIIVRKDVIKDLMGVDTAALFQARQISHTGAFLAGASSNGAQAANALAALFIATGQDAANVAESHAAITYAQLLDNGDYYWSVTLPSLIVATYGGGTGLATQRECLELLGCYGEGKAYKLAEICAAVVLAGDISLSAAVLHGDWVAAHDSFGRNRP